MSTKDPAVLFYTADFLTGVSGLTMEERGQYITLLCLQHQQGPLTEKQIRLAVGDLSDDVRVKFIVDSEGKLYNERMLEESAKRKAFVESRTKASRSRKAKTSHDTSYDTSYDNHTIHRGENENINENIDINDIENIIKYLNSKVGSTFDAHAPHVVSCVASCMRRGHTYEEMIKVIDYKASEWLHSNMAKYLRPSTLFGDKFERYIEELSCARRTPKWSDFDPEEALRRSIARAHREEVQGNGT